jgi:hypothetical protein
MTAIIIFRRGVNAQPLTIGGHATSPDYVPPCLKTAPDTGGSDQVKQKRQTSR